MVATHSRPLDPLGDALKRNSPAVGRFALSGVAAAAMFLAAGNAAALGLGRLTVQSALGESLRAEIDVTSLTPEEASNFQARVANPSAYRAAGVDYNNVLPSTQISLQRRADGRPFLRITSDRAVQEPFVDVILEISWATGRLVREYTLLLDPPTGNRQAAAPATAPVMSGGDSSTAAQASSPATAPSAAPTPRSAPAPAPAPRRAEAPSPQRAAEATGSGEDEYRVRRGDTLYGVAARVQRSGVSLDQMLVALYRANPDAFIADNINRLKAGAVLSVPSSSEAGSVSNSEARQLIQAQSADFAAYRQRLAGAVPKVAASDTGRQATGQVQASVEDRKQAAAPTPDKLTLSKGQVAAPGASAEDRIAQERQKQEAAARVAELSRNVEDLKKMTTPAGGAPAPGPTASPAPATAASPAVTPPVQVAAAPAPAPAPEVASAPAVDAPAAVPEPASAPAELAAASEPAVAEAPASAAPAPAPMPVPAEEPGLLDELLANPLVPAGAAILVALLAGLGFYRLRSRNKKDSGETSFLESRLQPDSFFGASGGQRIDTKDASGAPSSLSYSLSQLDAIGDVDPVAEADVYLAYGRDLQAEEILKEAMRSSPERLAIRTKLLEVYAKRRDTKGFEQLATQLYALTGGQGEDWAKAQELGVSIDPDNPMYKPGGHPETVQAGAKPVAEPLGASTMPQSVLPSPSRFEAGNSGIDSTSGVDLDLDIAGDNLATSAPAAMLDVTQPFNAPPSFDAPATADVRADDLNFELPTLAPTPSAAAAPAKDASLEFDLAGISLDLNAPANGGGTLGEAELPDLGGLDMAEGPGGDSDPLARKLELAEEFRQIGDLEGARDLLQEVVAKANGALRTKAQGMLDSLA